MNVPRTVGAVISARLASLHDLQTIYGTRDLYDMLEVLAVDRYNERKLIEHAQRRAKG